MHQIIRTVTDSNIVGVQFTNTNMYTISDLKLFAEVVCIEIGLKNLKKYIENNGYNHYCIQEHIRKIAKGTEEGHWNPITPTSMEYHESLFDVMYIKKLDELPLMINGDKDLIPVVKWRFQIGK